MDHRQQVIERIFEAQHDNGLWAMLPASHRHYPDLLHYSPNYKASLWALILLADLQCDRADKRLKAPLEAVKNHLFDPEHGIYSLKEDHFPIPCLNGNMLYLEGYFQGNLSEKSRQVLAFFYKNQRFDDGQYEVPKNQFCTNTSCYGKHTCYWGITKLLKGISFIPRAQRTQAVMELRDQCIQFILKHQVCYSSHQPEKIMVKGLDMLTFPNFYKSDFLEILWLLKREEIGSKQQYQDLDEFERQKDGPTAVFNGWRPFNFHPQLATAIIPSLELLKSKQRSDGSWNLERKMSNMVASVGEINQPNPFVTERAKEVMAYYTQLTQA